MEFEYNAADEYDEMECGEAAHITPLEMYAPAHRSRSWVRCVVKVISPGSYCMYLDESKRFLMSAKKFGPDLLYISTDENLPLVSKIPERKYIARIIERRGNFYLCLNGCALCDKSLGKYNCGYNSEHRELLAKVSYAIRSQCVANGDEVNMRCMLVSVPLLEKRCRVVWCPRALNTNCTSSFEDLGYLPGISMRLVNRLPEWDSELNSLSLKFHDNRVTAASSKNFLLYEETIMKERKPKQPLSSSAGSLQFGKCGEGVYNLDFKYPLSPLQAFGIALTTFANSCQSGKG